MKTNKAKKVPKNNYIFNDPANTQKIKERKKKSFPHLKNTII